MPVAKKKSPFATKGKATKKAKGKEKFVPFWMKKKKK